MQGYFNVKTWAADAREAMPPRVRDGCRILDHWLDKCRVRRTPMLVAASRPDNGQFEDYLFRIAPGLTMQVTRYRYDRDPTFWRTTAETVIAATCLAPLIKPQADTHRRELRGLIGDLSARGLPARLLRMTLVDIEEWEKPQEARFSVGVKTLGSNLRPVACWFEFDGSDPSGLKAELKKALSHLDPRQAMLTELKRSGAHGWIDDLALAAVLRQPKPAETICRLRDATSLMLPDGTDLFWMDGVVTSHHKDLNGLAWTHNIAFLKDRRVPELACSGVIDMPFTRLVEHAALTEQMIVRGIEGPDDPHGSDTRIDLGLRLHMLNTVRGTHWPTEDRWTGLRIADVPDSL